MRAFDPNQVGNGYKFTILGEPASKSNARQIVRIKNRLVPIKSRKALSYVASFEKQCPTLDPLMEGDLWCAIEVYYRTRRPDLDESLILDAMQGKIYANDRQIKEKHMYWNLDKNNPRATILIGYIVDDKP
jgi:Holliday junction resolvase RusA-like endonuclease